MKNHTIMNIFHQRTRPSLRPNEIWPKGNQEVNSNYGTWTYRRNCFHRRKIDTGIFQRINPVSQRTPMNRPETAPWGTWESSLVYPKFTKVRNHFSEIVFFRVRIPNCKGFRDIFAKSTCIFPKSKSIFSRSNFTAFNCSRSRARASEVPHGFPRCRLQLGIPTVRHHRAIKNSEGATALSEFVAGLDLYFQVISKVLQAQDSRRSVVSRYKSLNV